MPKGRAADLARTLVLGGVSVAGVALGLTISEGGHSAWRTVNAWGALALIGAVLTLAPALDRSFGVTPARARQVAVIGAAALVLFWVLFVLPLVGSNTSLLTTIGAGAGVAAAWLAPAGTAEGTSDAPKEPPTW